MRRTAMPSIDDQLRTRMREGAPRPGGDGDLVERLAARKHRRAATRRIGTIGLVAVVLLATAGTFVALGRAFNTDRVPGATPAATQTPPDLGLGFPICDVMSMPITVAGAQGNAYVFTKAIDACPKPVDGHRFVGADLDGDGTVDATAPELADCFAPVGCEAFAAPDVNGDGTSEIAVSTAGADGYGVWLYTVTADPPTIEPVRVELPPGFKGFVPEGPLQFAWVDVVGHFGGAHCIRLNDGSTDFVIVGGDRLGSTADVSSEVFALEGSTM